MSPSINWILSGLATLCLAGCMTAQVEFDDLHITRQNVTFDGLPAATSQLDLADIPEELRTQYAVAEPGSDFTLPSQRFTYANAADQIPDGVDASLTLKQVTVTSHDGRALTFLRKVVLTLTSPNEPVMVPRVIVDYSAECDPAVQDRQILLPIIGSSFTIKPWQIQAFVYELTITGNVDQLPHETWALDVTLSLSGEASYSY